MTARSSRTKNGGFRPITLSRHPGGPVRLDLKIEGRAATRQWPAALLLSRCPALSSLLTPRQVKQAHGRSSMLQAEAGGVTISAWPGISPNLGR
jgi:hypothetical protein